MEQDYQQRRFLMNSLQELNNRSSTTSISFTDQRTAGFAFDRDVPLNQTLTIDEGQLHGVPIGINITEVINYDTFTSYYEIDISAVTSATLSWLTVPDYMTVTNPSTGVYRITGFRSQADWALVRQPIITLAPSYFGTANYTATIGKIVSGVTTEVTWTVSLTVIELNTLTTASNFFWNISSNNSITGNPTIQDADSAVTYTVTITPSETSAVSSLSSLGSGGTSSFNTSTKVLTITGTKTQVNSHLNSITLASTAVEVNYTLTYVARNNSNNSLDTKIQNLRCNQIKYLSTLTTASVTYNEDTAVAVSGGPIITDIDRDGTGTYTLLITGSGVRILSATGTGGTVSFNESNRTLSIVGNRTQVNSYINNITLTPAADFAQTFSLVYTVTVPGGDTQNKTQLMVIGTTSPEITGMDINRFYCKNTATFLFEETTYIDTNGNTTSISQPTPFISDADTIPATYTINFSMGQTSLGFFSDNNQDRVENYTFSGTREQCDLKFRSIRYYALKGDTSDNTIIYRQSKNGNLHAQITFTVSGIDTGGTTFQNEFVFTASQTWNPPADAVTYKNSVSIMLMGGGGGGIIHNGGGGGGRTNIVNFNLQPQPYELVIGLGGEDGNPGSLFAPDGGTTFGFGNSAPGGSGGKNGFWDDVNTPSGHDISYGGQAGLINNTTAGSLGGGNYEYESIKNPGQFFYGGGGGGGAASTAHPTRQFLQSVDGYIPQDAGLNYNVQANLQNWSNKGGDSFRYPGFSSDPNAVNLIGGSGGAAYEFPTGSGKFYGGGGAGSGGPHDSNVGAASGNGNGGAGFYLVPNDFNDLTEVYNKWGGGGYGGAVGNTSTFLYPTQVYRLDGAKGGGGGGTPAGDIRAGRGGDGVIVVRIT